jgi:hypothetical protein
VRAEQGEGRLDGALRTAKARGRQPNIPGRVASGIR